MMRTLLLGAALFAGILPARGEDCRHLEKMSRFDEARACFQRQTRSNSLAERAEGHWGLGDRKAALAEFDQAVKADPKNPMLQVRLGYLFLDGFNEGDAAASFEAALKVKPDFAPAYLGIATMASDAFDRRAIDFANRALKSDPKLVGAQELLASLAMDEGDLDRATAEAQKALQMSNEALDALAVLAGVDYFKGSKTSKWTDQMLALSPHYGVGFQKIAHWFSINRRYQESIFFSRKALEVQPDYLRAKSELGVSLMRTAQDAEAYRLLKDAYEHGYISLQTKNSLRLLERNDRFNEIAIPNGVLKVAKKESDLLKPYFEFAVEKNLADYNKKYETKLPGPVRIEFYPDHEDFAVRTMGMPGLGALGVTFGLSVAMDSPSGRAPGTFHWASTLRHEMSHIYTLSLTGHRIPRWMTEGIAVHEETAASPEWGDRVTPDVLAAVKGDKLLPVADLDRGFMRPSFPGQVVISYFQAGKLIDYIVEKYGWPKVLAMVRESANNQSTPLLIERVLGVKPADLDAKFKTWLNAQLKPALDGVDEFTKGLRPLNQALRQEQWDQVIADGGKLIALYPDFVQPGNPYEAVAQAYQKKGDKANAVRVLTQYSDHGGLSVEAHRTLGELQMELGHPKEAKVALERTIWIDPSHDDRVHTRLAKLSADAGDWKTAVLEYSAVLAMKPTDPAQAHYDLALAYRGLGDPQKAEEQVLASLEQAPGFRPAQKLLLELNQDPKGKEN